MTIDIFSLSVHIWTFLNVMYYMVLKSLDEYDGVKGK